jgi:hypothetical protein
MPRCKGAELRNGQSKSYVQDVMKAVSSIVPGAMGPTMLADTTPLTHVFLWAYAASLLRICPVWRGGIYTSTDTLQGVRHTHHVCRLYTARKVSTQESSCWHQAQVLGLRHLLRIGPPSNRGAARPLFTTIEAGTNVRVLTNGDVTEPR